MNVLVVPTIREDCIKRFLRAWDTPDQNWGSIIVVEDNPDRTFDIQGVKHYCWKDIDADLGKDAWIISRRDCAIKCYGILQASRLEPDFIFVLDDDCYPWSDSFVEGFQDKHVKNLLQTPKWVESVPGVRTRGLPYFNQGTLSTVKFSVGLWKGVPDFDAITCMAHGIPTHFTPPVGTRVIAPGQYFPFCGMNFAMKADAAVMCYFPLMGLSSPYGRFDDIWFGIIAKKICDHLGFHITCGEPWVLHEKASNTLNNLVKEAPGVKMHETLWEKIDQIPLTGNSPKACMLEIGDHLGYDEDGYLSKLGRAICVWANLFD